MKPLVLALVLVAAGDALRCYQGEQNASLPVQGSPMECLATSRSCLFYLDHAHSVVARGCQLANCTQNGALVSRTMCTNRTNSAKEWPHIDGPTTYCCCYGDGCNTEIEAMQNADGGPAATRTNLAQSIAQRIEDFYEHDASAAERTFLRRVIEHVYQHLD